MSESLFGKGIPLGMNFDLGAEKALDARTVVATYADLKAHEDGGRCYEGLIVYVKDEKTNYQYTDSEWKEFGKNNNSSVVVDKYEDIANLKEVEQGALIYVKSDSNKNGEQNIYVVTRHEVVNGICIPKEYMTLNSFTKNQVPSLSYDSSMPEGKRIYLNSSDELILRFNFSSDSYGDGKYRIYNNGSLMRSFSAPKGNVLINLGSFNVDGAYSIEVAATDYFGVNAPVNLEFKVIVGGLELKSTFDEILNTTIYEVGNKIRIPYTAKVSDTTQQIKTLITVTQPSGAIKTDTVVTQLSTISAVWENSSFFTSRGLYKVDLQCYTGKDVNDTTEGTFLSNKISYTFRVLAQGEIGIISEFSGQIDTNTYVSIPFKVTQKGSSMLIMKGTLKKDGRVIKTTPDVGLTVNCNITSYWGIGRLEEGTYEYELVGFGADGDKNNRSIDSAVGRFLVVVSAYQRVNPVEGSLIAWFDANDRRNSDEERNIWKNKDALGLKDSYRIELHDLNYDSNGWKSIDGLSDDSNGEFALKMDGQSWGQLVEVNVDGTTTPYCPLAKLDGQLGITIEASIKTRCNGNLNAKVFTCMEGITSNTPGISIGFNEFYSRSNNQSLSMEFMENEWVHVAFVIDKEIRQLYGINGLGQENIEDLNQVRTMRIYINGVLCGCTTLVEDDKFSNALGKTFPLMINACMVDGQPTEFADSEIKFIRIYNRPLRSSEIVTNYVSHFFDQDEQQAMKDRNDVNVVTLPTIKFIRKPDRGIDNPYFSRLHSITDKDESKKVFVECTMEYYHPDGTIDTFDNVDVYLQGTSSLQYPVKNYKIKKYDAPVENSNRKKEKFVPPPKEGQWVSDSTYTLKVDYMEQSHMNNTPIAVFYDQVIDALGAASPARKNGYRDSIDGFPCIVYYNENVEDPSTGASVKDILVGSFMFNIDKEGKELGFECEVTDDTGKVIENKCVSYEGTANTSDTAGCFFAFDDNFDKVYNYYIEDSYMKHLDKNKLSQLDLSLSSFKEQVNSGKLKDYFTFEEYKKEYTETDYVISDFEARYSYCEDDEEATYEPMKQLIRWVSSCWEKQEDGSFKLNGTKFEDEFEEHFDKKYMLAYYLQMQVFAQVDNCGKNCMWDTWDGKKFYPRPYDMDTSMGLSNTGTEIIRPDAEIIPSLSPTKATGHIFAGISNGDTTQTDDRYMMFNTTTSRLWNAFAVVFKEDIANTYISLRANVYTYDNIIKSIFAMTQDVIGEIYYNKDAGSKYLQLITENDTVQIQKLHGNRQQRYKRFLSERLIFLDSVYEYLWSSKQTDSLYSECDMRSDAAYEPGAQDSNARTVQCYLGVSVYSPQYVKISVGSGKDAVVIGYVSPKSKYIDPTSGQEKDGTLFSFPIAGQNKELGVFGAGNIRRLDRLETLDLTSINAERLKKILEIDISGASRLSLLKLGDNEYLRKLNCSRARLLGTDKEGGTLNISKCKNLQDLDISQTSLIGVSFPNNTNLVSCDLSYTPITAININGAEFLNNIKITNCDMISDFVLNRCNRLETLNISNSSVQNCTATNCKVLKLVDVSNCRRLEAFDLTNSNTVEELIMKANSGPLMQDLHLYSLYGLKKLDVSGSASLGTIRFPKYASLEEAAKGENGKLWDSLTYFNASNSTLKKIQYGSGDNNNTICDFSQLKNLDTLILKGANRIEEIKGLFYQTENNINTLFQNCTYLRRIEGRIKTSGTSAAGLFDRCSYLSDIDDLIFEFEKDGKPCITNGDTAFRCCACATTPMIKKFLDACGSSLKSIEGLIYMWGPDEISRDNAVIGSDKDTTRTIPDDLFENTKNITNMNSAFLLTHYKKIPGTLLDNTPNVENLNQTFLKMDKLEEVGESLLKNKKMLNNCKGTFADCTSLVKYMNEDPKIFEGSGNVTTTEQMFYNCPKLAATSIEDLFTPLEKLKTTAFMFGYCSALKAPVPLGVFSTCTSLQTLDGTFAFSGITGIPNMLFRKFYTDDTTFSSLINARNLFASCTNLVGTVHKHFFAGASSLQDIGYTCNTVRIFSDGAYIACGHGFFGTTLISGYHEDFLSQCPNLTNVSRLFYTSTSASSSLKNALQFYYVFKDGQDLPINGCSVSPNLFKSNTKVRNTQEMFAYNESLVGDIPPTILYGCRNSIQNVSGMFRGCIKLNGTNADNIITGISNQWFKDCANLVDASNFLNGCKNMKVSTDGIPEDLFADCTKLQNVSYFFADCSNIDSEIPRGLFDSCRSSLKSVAYLFHNCSLIHGSIPQGEYKTVAEITGYEIVAPGTSGAYQVLTTPTDYTTQVSYEQVILIAPDLEGQVTGLGNSYVKPKTSAVKRTVKAGFLANCLLLESADSIFRNCQKISGGIPEDIFHTDSAMDRYLKLSNVNNMFRQCYGMTTAYVDTTTNIKYICSENLFAKCPEIVNASAVFYRIQNMEACNIPTRLFKNQTKIQNASYLFFLTRHLTGPIEKEFLRSSLGSLKYADHMFCYTTMKDLDPGFLNPDGRNTVLINVGCIFHRAFASDGAKGTSPEFWNTDRFTSIDMSSANGYHHALALSTKLSNYAYAATLNEGNWVTDVAH